jgi:NADH-quinone oxidoreductase subunit A
MSAFCREEPDRSEDQDVMTPAVTTALLAVETEFQLSTYYPILLYAGAVVSFAILNLALAHLIGPFAKKTPVKQMPYESGMDPTGDARQHFDVKFYLIAILFLVFDVELLFLYPWAVVAYHTPPVLPDADVLRLPIFFEVLAFIGTLVLGYVYAWRKGVFQWR